MFGHENLHVRSRRKYCLQLRKKQNHSFKDTLCNDTKIGPIILVFEKLGLMYIFYRNYIINPFKDSIILSCQADKSYIQHE